MAWAHPSLSLTPCSPSEALLRVFHTEGLRQWKMCLSHLSRAPVEQDLPHCLRVHPNLQPRQEASFPTLSVTEVIPTAHSTRPSRDWQCKSAAKKSKSLWSSKAQAAHARHFETQLASLVSAPPPPLHTHWCLQCRVMSEKKRNGEAEGEGRKLEIRFL